MKNILKKIKPMRVLIYLALFAAVLFAVVVFVAFREEINSGTVERLRDFFRWGGDEEAYETFRFDPGRQNRYEVAGGRLVLLSPERFAFYDKTGYEKYSRSLAYKMPALCRAGDKVIAYDRMEPGCLVAGERSVLLELPERVTAAAGNDRGQFILVTKEDNYRSAARLYDKKNKPAYVWRSSRYIMAAGLSPLGTRMAVAAVGQGGDLIGARVTFLEVGREEPLREIDLPDVLPLYIFYPDNSHVCIITESLVYFYTDKGDLLGEHGWDGETLLRYASSTEALFLQLGRYADGQYSRLACLGYEGAVLDTMSFNEGLTDFSAAGKFISLLEPDGRITRYTIAPDGLKQPLRAGGEGARGVLQQDKGSALILFQDYAVWDMT